MRLRRASPLLLLVLAPLIAADLEEYLPKPGETIDKLSNDQIRALGRPPKAATPPAAAQKDESPDLTGNPRSTQSTRSYKGTEDAPVDGLDGKPHAGPFVDTTPEETRTRKGGAGATSTAKSIPTSLEKLKGAASSEDGWKLEDIPQKNDGVMNDDNRPLPKKGTTGTEGGVSEKDKERKAKGVQENKPQAPSEAPPLPHSEQEHLELARAGGAEKSKQATSKDAKVGEKDAKQADAPKKKGADYGDGGYGMEKPTDLPEKPHNIPHPDPKNPTMPGSGSTSQGNSDEPSIGNSNKWLKDTMPYTEGVKRPSTDSSAGASPTAAGELEWHEWFHSFVLSLTMILFSEIGDKTFLIAALMAMRHARLLVFSAAFSALIAMTVLSAVLGHAVPTLLPKRFTTFAAAALFLVFGVRMLHEGLAMSPDSGVGEEMKEVEAELEEKEHRASRASPYALESGRGRKSSNAGKHPPSPPSSRPTSPSRGPRDRFAGVANLFSLVLSPAWVQTFIMTFLGEWGDRSQIATIAMAAGQDYWWVTLGAITGHACCTGLAVIGGRALAGRVSMRVVTIGGAVAFLVFGVIYLYECFAG